MKRIAFFLLLLGCFDFFLWADSCTACPNNCKSQVCTATAPAGGTVDCYEDDTSATCTSLNADGSIDEETTVTCGGGGGGGGFGGGAGGDCQIYWWTCDPWAY